MRFGKGLQESVYEPWKDKYIEYAKLKGMLREYDADDDTPWTEEEEQAFSDEIFNCQLEKIAQFQLDTFNALQARVDTTFTKLKSLAPADPATKSDITAERLKEVESELDAITDEVKELRRYSNVNYTGFLKIVKKHDRKRGDRYKIRPMMLLRLSRRPFNSEEGYSPLLNKLSVMYFVIRQNLEQQSASVPEPGADQETKLTGVRYTSQKFWVHPDNLLEVKTSILRRLPSLVFSQLASSKDIEVSEDPTITTIYFDNPKFQIYTHKVDQVKATSLRLRWYGQLSTHPTITLEKKTVDKYGLSEEERFPIKSKYIKAFIDGKYKMEKSIQKMERQGQTAEEIDAFKKVVGSIADFIQENKLEPVVRANYVRAAFQKPSDDRVRISLDTDIAFIREDTLDRGRPCRDPESWHRSDIDDSNIEYPFKNINQSEVNILPYALLEIKIKETENRKQPEWVSDLMGSHLVYAVPRFSKFVHAVAALFDDYVNSIPFWISHLGTDIRKDPHVAFEEEEARRAEQAEGDEVVGSFLGKKVAGSYQAIRGTPLAQSHISERLAAEVAARSAVASPTPTGAALRGTTAADSARREGGGGYGSTSIFPGLSFSRYSRARRDQRNNNRALPEGVEEPTAWIKNAGPLKIEPKVWLANERTFLKWQHICILLGSLSVALYTAAGGDLIAEVSGILYIGIAVMAGGWGYYMHRARRLMIVGRSGRDFDNVLGPLAVALSLMVSLVLNFYFQYRAAFSGVGGDEEGNSTVVVGGVEELRV